MKSHGYAVRKLRHEVARIPVHGIFRLASVLVYLLRKIAFFIEQRDADHRDAHIRAAFQNVAREDAEAARVCRYLRLQRYLHREIGGVSESGVAVQRFKQRGREVVSVSHFVHLLQSIRFFFLRRKLLKLRVRRDALRYDRSRVGIILRVALRFFEIFHKRGDVVFASRDLFRYLRGAQRVGEHLARLDARNVAEEPGARGVHEHAHALHLDKRREHTRGGVRYTAEPLREERLPVLAYLLVGQRQAAFVKLYRLVAQPPRVAVSRDLRLVQLVDRSRESVEGLAHRAAPFLVPALAAARVTAAVRAPALHAVGAGP